MHGALKSESIVYLSWPASKHMPLINRTCIRLGLFSLPTKAIGGPHTLLFFLQPPFCMGFPPTSRNSILHAMTSVTVSHKTSMASHSNFKLVFDLMGYQVLWLIFPTSFGSSLVKLGGTYLIRTPRLIKGFRIGIANLEFTDILDLRIQITSASTSACNPFYHPSAIVILYEISQEDVITILKDISEYALVVVPIPAEENGMSSREEDKILITSLVKKE
ncbi:hypothetical protein VNO77_19130 [Canavalia gladiata]|uniref:Uncharacterized protein n=1 Tax=Canavalia gladiata TaxID=3824 RepID=A0AAN9LQT5_CANGL